jgi:hypothetical protein
MTLAHLTKTMYLLGYMDKENRVYLMDKSYNLFSYSLLVSVLVYQTAIVRRDFEVAEQALANIPEDQYNRIARFLEGQGLKELALKVTTDPEHKFDLALQCGNLELGREIALEADSQHKWKQLGDAALNQKFDLKLAEECFKQSKDLGGLLLLHTSLGDKQGIEQLAEQAADQGCNNVAFLCLFLLGRVEECTKVLRKTDRVPEAAFMTRTYLPSQISNILGVWKKNLQTVSEKAAEALADPADYPDLFPDLEFGVQAEQFLAKQREGKAGSKLMRARYYEMVKESVSRDLVQELKEDGELVDDGAFVEDDDEGDLGVGTDTWGSGQDAEAEAEVDLAGADEADLGLDLDLGPEQDEMDQERVAQEEAEAKRIEAEAQAILAKEEAEEAAAEEEARVAAEAEAEAEEAAAKAAEESAAAEAKVEETKEVDQEEEKPAGKKKKKKGGKKKQTVLAAGGDDIEFEALDDALASVPADGDIPNIDDLNSDLAALDDIADSWDLPEP